jgi:transposase
LAQAGFCVSIVNPAQAHHFAKALLKRAKSDAIDAQTLTCLAALLQPAPWTPPPAIYLELQQRLAQREALIGLRQQVRNQRHALLQAPTIVASVRERMESLLTTLDEQITTVERELKEVIRLDASWAATATLLLSIPGVGLITAAWLVVSTLNFSVGTTPEQLAAYAGLAPMVHESGTSVRDRPRIGHGGNGRLRTAVWSCPGAVKSAALGAAGARCVESTSFPCAAHTHKSGCADRRAAPPRVLAAAAVGRCKRAQAAHTGALRS